MPSLSTNKPSTHLGINACGYACCGRYLCNMCRPRFAPHSFWAFANVFLHINRFPASQGTAAKLGEPQQAREPRSTQLAKWTHWGLNPGPSACADVILVHGFSPVLGRLFGLHWSWGTRVGTGEGHCPSQSGIPGSQVEMRSPHQESNLGCCGHDATS